MTHITTVLLLSLALCACRSDAESAPPAADPGVAPLAPAPAEVKSAPAEAAPASDRVDDPTFELAAASAGPYATDKLASFAISLKPRGEYHINQDFPISVSVQLSAGSAGIDFPKAKLDKPQAAEFDEQLARFDVPFTPRAAGMHKVEAQVKLAVCTPENCVPVERTLAVVLPVE
jgi:hypothetical protein